jgi:transposase-like protein
MLWPWYRWALERLGLEYRHERFGIRNRVERFFRYLKERTAVFHHKMSARDHIQGIKNLKLFLNLFTLRCWAVGVAKMLIRTLSRV